MLAIAPLPGPAIFSSGMLSLCPRSLDRYLLLPAALHLPLNLLVAASLQPTLITAHPP